MAGVLTSDFDDMPVDYDDAEIGCCNCGYSGGRHGCMDDLCRGSYPDDECPDAIPCLCCNAHGEWR